MQKESRVIDFSDIKHGTHVAWHEFIFLLFIYPETKPRFVHIPLCLWDETMQSMHRVEGVNVNTTSHSKRMCEELKKSLRQSPK